jgi:hypothetical protein
MPRSTLLALCALAGSLAAGCGSGPPPPERTVVDPAMPDATQGTGKIFVDWTLAGRAPSDASCTGIDHLTLLLTYDTRQVEIAPIPCTLTRFRYDTLPEGLATIEIDGLDTSGCTTTAGVTDIDVTNTLPPMPQPTISLDAPIACR